MIRRLDRRYFLALVVVALVAVGLAIWLTPTDQPKQPQKLAEGTVVNVSNSDQLHLALDHASGGTSIHLAAGSYDGVYLTNRVFQPPLMVTGSGAGPTNETSSSLDGIRLQNVTGLALSNVRVKKRIDMIATREASVEHCQLLSGIWLREGSSRIAIKANDIQGGRFGVWINSDPKSLPSDQVDIAENDIHDQTSDNIQIGWANRITIEDNKIHDLQVNDDHNDGIQVMRGRDITIRRNRFSDQDEAVILKAETGIAPSAQVLGVRIENNVVTESRGAGFIVAGTTDVQLVNNTAAKNRFADIHIEGSNPNLRIWNNVVHEIFRTVPFEGEQHDNCIEVDKSTTPDDVHSDGINFVDKSLRLARDDACARAATDVGAPPDDVEKNSRSQPTIAGAWATVAPEPQRRTGGR